MSSKSKKPKNRAVKQKMASEAKTTGDACGVVSDPRPTIMEILDEMRWKYRQELFASNPDCDPSFMCKVLDGQW